MVLIINRSIKLKPHGTAKPRAFFSIHTYRQISADFFLKKGQLCSAKKVRFLQEKLRNPSLRRYMENYVIQIIRPKLSRSCMSPKFRKDDNDLFHGTKQCPKIVTKILPSKAIRQKHQERKQPRWSSVYGHGWISRKATGHNRKIIDRLSQKKIIWMIFFSF